MDDFIPKPEKAVDKDFLLPVEEVFSITGRGTVATGRIETGVVHTGDAVEILGLSDFPRTSIVDGVQMFGQRVDEGEAGDNVGLSLRGIEKTDIKRGMVIAQPGAFSAHRIFRAPIYILTKEEGGRHTPFF